MSLKKVLSQSTDVEETIQKVEDALDVTKLVTERLYLSLISRQTSSVDLILREDEQIKAQLEEAIKSLVEISEYSRDER